MRSPAFRWVERGVQQPMAQLVLASRAIEQWSNGTNRVRSSQWLTREKREAGSYGQSRWIPSALRSRVHWGWGRDLFCFVWYSSPFASIPRSRSPKKEAVQQRGSLSFANRSLHSFPITPTETYAGTRSVGLLPSTLCSIRPQFCRACCAGLACTVEAGSAVRKCNRANEVTG